jgi:hypothetical protein
VKRKTWERKRFFSIPIKKNEKKIDKQIITEKFPEEFIRKSKKMFEKKIENFTDLEVRAHAEKFSAFRSRSGPLGHP